jgi:ABC-type multidrug transport system fused ATPase/permease subunit
MIFKLIRAPLSYFDKTPSGNIISRFSNDLGILDNSLAFAYVSFFSGFSITAVMAINIFEVNIIYIIPCLIQIFFIVLLYILYKKPLKRTH